MRYPITPVSKPRMTQRDKWKQRPCVMKYRDYCDELRRHKVKIKGDHLNVAFALPMPKSWSKKKREAMRYSKHKQTPDVDNLCKAIMDALLDNDSHIWSIRAHKVWDETGWVEIL